MWTIYSLMLLRIKENRNLFAKIKKKPESTKLSLGIIHVIMIICSIYSLIHNNGGMFFCYAGKPFLRYVVWPFGPNIFFF
jgi:hypothetical protein